MTVPPAAGGRARGAQTDRLLDVDNAVPRLLEWSLIDDAALVDSDLEVSSVPRRNRNLRVERRHGPGFLIKQPDPTIEGSDRTFRREVGFYEFCRREPRAAGVARHMACLHAAFPEDGVLVIELLRGGRSLWREHREDPRLDRLPAWHRALGEALGTVHGTFKPGGLGGDPRLTDLPVRAPWALSLHRPGLRLLRHLSPANRQLLKIVQGEPGIGKRLDQLLLEWRTETIIHGDVKLDNVVALGAEGERSAEIRLVDWEFVRKGDPAWDVAGVLQDALLLWLLSMPPATELEPAARTAAAELPLSALRPAVAAFWQGYLSTAMPAPGDASSLLRRAVSLSGARLIQSAWEHSLYAEGLFSWAVLALQVAANILADPDQAGRQLYDLSPEAGSSWR